MVRQGLRKIYRNGYWFQYDLDRPFVRFLGGGKKVKLPPVADPIPTPEDIDIQAQQKGEAERRRLRAKKGIASTILTEAPLGIVGRTQKSTILGETV